MKIAEKTLKIAEVTSNGKNTLMHYKLNFSGLMFSEAKPLGLKIVAAR